MQPNTSHGRAIVIGGSMAGLLAARVLADHYRQMDDAVLRPYLGGDREQVFVRTGAPDLCARMPGCRLSDAVAPHIRQDAKL